MFYESIYDVNELTTDTRPIMFVDEWSRININEAFIIHINKCTVPHEIWISDECLALYFNQWTPGVSATWLDDRGPHDGKKVGWYWVEKLHDPENNRRAISLEIADYRKFVWVFYLTPENYDQRLNIRKGVWPD